LRGIPEIFAGGLNMHLGNGAITLECAAVTTGLAAAGLAAAGAAIYREKPGLAKVGQAAACGCLVFAAQAVNVPIGTSTSAHLVGSVLAAWLLGPAVAVWMMALVLAVQALVLGDGGVLALGANTINIAIVPVSIWAAMKRPAFGGDAWMAGVAALVSVPLAAVLIVAETAAFRNAGQLAGWGGFASLMLGTHLVIGALEGAATAGIVVLACSRELATMRRPAVIAAACVVALFVALALPISSALPDGYESAAESSGMEWLLTP
jgi:cobalt/nickel transport system permease protein